MNIQPLILCGSSGSRMWPFSREQYPKQLLNLAGELSMLQATTLRLQGLPLSAVDRLKSPILIGNEEYRFLMAEQLRQIGVVHGGMMLEPCGRNTAPAPTLGALLAWAGGDDPVLVIMPADHVIQDEAAFRAAVALVVPLADAGKLLTFGICPTAPETGYGYIRVGGTLGEGASLVEQFVEKPDQATAQGYLDSGRYLWNSGIFLIKVSVWLAKMVQCRPDILAACEAAFAGRQQDMDFVRAGQGGVRDLPVGVDRLCGDGAVDRRRQKFRRGRGGAARCPLVGCRCLERVAVDRRQGRSRQRLQGRRAGGRHRKFAGLTSGWLVATVGLQDVVVVETPDAILVADRKQIQKVKDVVGQLSVAACRNALSPQGV